MPVEQARWIDLADPAAEVPTGLAPSLPRRAAATMGVMARGFPYLVRLRRSRFALETAQR